MRVDSTLALGVGLGLLAACPSEPGVEAQGSSGIDFGAEASSAAASSASTSKTDELPTGGAEDTETGAPSFDVPGPDDPVGGCGQGGGGAGFSYIWIANSAESTVSKINTQTLVEEGRYRVHPLDDGNPSRTSVNLDGDVVVANRGGGLTKIIAEPERCPDAAETSTGPDDVRPWTDGCIAWHTPFEYASQRPVAWTRGIFDPATCAHEGAKVWSAGTDGQNVFDVMLLDGETGVVEATVDLNAESISPRNLGLYGGAVDADGNFWASHVDDGHLVRVDVEDFSIQAWPLPGQVESYGMTVDASGRPWLCGGRGVARFDPLSTSFDIELSVAVDGGGCMVDAENRLWVAGKSSPDTLVGIDVETLEPVRTLEVPGYAKGISIDFEGHVWAVEQGSRAHRVDPDTGAVETVMGLNGAYTYSDMTGFALSNAGVPEG